MNRPRARRPRFPAERGTLWPRLASLAAGAALLLASLPGSEPALVFVDVALQAGLSQKNIFGDPANKRYTLEVTGNGCAFFDYDRDGHQDILLVNGSTLEGFRKGGNPLCHLYRNEGKGRFLEVTAKAGLTASGWGMGVTIADIDNDGWEDIYLTGFGFNVLYRNDGKGAFSDVTRSAGVRDGGWSTGASFGDFDRDGFVDLFVTHYLQLDLDRLPEHGSTPLCRYRGIPVHCGPKGLPAETGRLYRNNGNLTFSDVSARAGILQDKRYYGFMPVWVDYDVDGWPDLFVANDSTPNLLYHNSHNGTFREVGLETGAAVSEDGREQASMGADFGDVDRDGRQDLIVTNFSDDYDTLYRNGPGDVFSDISTRAGIGTATWNSLGWGTGFLDYDNDGLLDIFCANGHIYPEVDQYQFGTRYRQPKTLLKNLGNLKFQDVARTTGSGLVVEKSSRGSALGDYDNDGDTDILVVNINDRPSLFENRGGNRASWIGFLTEGVRCNRNGLGARLEIRFGPRRSMAEVRSASGYLSQNDRRVLFGLRDATAADSLELHWPDGQVERFDNLPARRYYRLRQGEAPRPIP